MNDKDMEAIAYATRFWTETLGLPFVQQSAAMAAPIIAVQSLVGDGAIAATPLNAEPFMELLWLEHGSQI